MDLYHPIILALNSAPRHFGRLDEATIEVDVYNPLCGDEYKLFVKCEDSTIRQATFIGYGCAVSKASIDILIEHIQGKSLKVAIDKIQLFLKIFSEKGDLEHPDLEALQIARNYPARQKCATLAWECCSDHLDQLSI